MLPENKLTSHGKQVTSGAQTQIPNVNQQEEQGPLNTLGTKGTGPANHGVKTNQMSTGNPGLKSVGQSGSNVGVGGMLKTKAKRERSVSVDAGDQKAVMLDPDAKVEGLIRSKRRCVLKKKQPYSGDEWCSGAETDEDEEKPPVSTHTVSSRMAWTWHLMGQNELHPGERVTSCPSISGTAGTVSEQSRPALVSQAPQQVVYVFTTNLANSAAEAVMHGHTDSILLFHQKNVPRTRLDQKCAGIGKLASLSEQLSSNSTPTMGTPKSQSGTPRPASVGGIMGGQTADRGTPCSTGHPESDTQVHPDNNSVTTHPHRTQGCGVDGSGMTHPGTGVSPSVSPSVLSAHLQGEGSMGRLSKEQLEHREHCLQTLRDFEKLFLRSGDGRGDPTDLGPNGNPNNGSVNDNIDGCTGENIGEKPGALSPGMKKLGPLQSMISQTQNISGPAMDDALMGRHHGLPPHHHHHHHHLSSPSGMDLGPVLGPDGLTPEQAAWRKLQEEYYQEKRRRQEINPHFRMMPEMVPGGPQFMMRGPPPPYHSKPGEWVPRPINGGGNLRMRHQEAPRGPRMLNQMQGYPGSPGGVLPMEGLGPQRSPRPGIGWMDDVPPHMVGGGGPGGGGGQFHGCYPSGQMQSGLDRPLSREEMFHIMEKRQLQGLRQQQQGGLRIMDNPGGPGFPDTLDFISSRGMIGSPVGGGPLMRDVVDPSLNVNLQQHQVLAQKLREGHGSEMIGSEDDSCIRDGQVGANKMAAPGPDVPLQFPGQAPFPGQVDGLYMQSAPEMFDPQIGETSRLSHLPMNAGQKGADFSIGSPALPLSHQLKSPSLTQDPSPIMPSPSNAGLKSPNQLPSTGAPHPPVPASSGAATPTTTSKSPQVMDSTLGLRSPSGSPGQLKPPAMPVASPRWTTSPKTSPGGAPSSKGVGNGGSRPTDTGMPLPPRSGTSTPSLNAQPPSMPFTSSPGTPPSQNPLSLIMSQMSKYAMPTTTPIYHDAIKTIATSDDDMPADRLLVPGAGIQGNMANHQSTQILLPSQSSLGPHSGPQSPLGMALQGNQTLLLDPPNSMSMPAMMGGGGPPEPCNLSPMHVPSQMGGFSHMQATLHSPTGGMGQQYNPSDEILPAEQMHLLSKGMPPHLSHSFQSMPMAEGPDLSEVIRPTHTGIPEFDLSRIIPADKPSSTLQYFPKNEAMSQLQPTPHQRQAASAQLLKQLSRAPHGSAQSSNPHIANLQNMMAEQQLGLPGLRPGMVMTQGGSRGLNTGGGMGPMCHPGHLIGRTGMPAQMQQMQQMQQQQSMMTNSLLHHQSYPQQNMMMIQAKQRGMPIPGEHFGPQGPILEPPHPQSVMMGPKGIRQRGLSLDSPLGYGPGGISNMPF